jgi:hypothetical protein
MRILAHHTRLRAVFGVCLAAALAVFALTRPVVAQDAASVAGEADTSTSDLSQLQQTIESTAAAYNAACDQYNQLTVRMCELEAQIAQVQEQLPAQREKAAAAIRALYLMQQDTPGLIGLLLSSDTFNEFISTMTYLDAVQNASVAEANKLVELEDTLAADKRELEAARIQASEAMTTASAALSQATAARDAVVAEARAQAAAEEEAAAAAVAAAAAQEAAANQQVDTPASPTTEGVDIASERDAFVAQWAPRIDAYLAGSPMAGTGTTFAQAAWDYGVDPRWSPAIAHIESSKGAHCFKPYNAWGWGNASWGSWDEAIRAHVAGLARGYGSTISVAAAKKYCPSNWEHWYSATLAQMERI